jgi:hypothetical protein
MFTSGLIADRPLGAACAHGLQIETKSAVGGGLVELRQTFASLLRRGREPEKSVKLISWGSNRHRLLPLGREPISQRSDDAAENGASLPNQSILGAPARQAESLVRATIRWRHNRNSASSRLRVTGAGTSGLNGTALKT